MFPSIGQQETECGNPREKGNTRNEPQFSLAFSPGTHSKLQHREQRALNSMPCRSKYWSSGEAAGIYREREKGWQKSEWVCPTVLSWKLDCISAENTLRGPAEKRGCSLRAPQGSWSHSGWEMLDSYHLAWRDLASTAGIQRRPGKAMLSEWSTCPGKRHV